VLSTRNDDELRGGNEFLETLRVSEGEVAFALSPENEHRAPDLLVVRGQSGQQALIAGAHSGKKQTHVTPSEVLPEVGLDFRGESGTSFEKTASRPVEHQPGKVLDEEPIPPPPPEKPNLPRNFFVPQNQRVLHDDARDPIGEARGGGESRLAAHVHPEEADAIEREE